MDRISEAPRPLVGELHLFYKFKEHVLKQITLSIRKKWANKSMNDSRLVYSTETGRICPECGKSVSACSCKKKKPVKADTQPTGYPNDGTIRIQREVKGHKGKIVTAVFGVPLENEELQKFAKTLKRRCGAGGSVKDRVIVIQGDHRHTLLDEIKKHGYTAKLAGG
jgi:translation initiation factor 1